MADVFSTICSVLEQRPEQRRVGAYNFVYASDEVRLYVLIERNQANITADCAKLFIDVLDGR